VSDRDDQAEVRVTASEVDELPARREPEQLPERRPEGGGLTAPEERPVVPHAKRFRLVTGALAFLALAALAAAVSLATGGRGADDGDAASWSTFKPSSDGLDSGAREIAAHVGRQYRLPSGQQIVAVTGGPLELQGMPMRIAVRESPADGGDITVLEGRGVLYRMCGLGPKCAIASGKPSPERALLLQREALELALYSFHDLEDVENVVVFMPPPKGRDPEVALHFRRGDVAGQLTRPLRSTLPGPAPTPATIDRSPDTPFVQQLTLGNIFRFSLTQGNQDASVFLVLDPLPTQS
jgi:hypothetical protein